MISDGARRTTARSIEPDGVPAFVGILAAAQAEALMRALRPVAVAPVRRPENLSVEDAAKRLGISASYVYKNSNTLPFVRRIGRRVVCDLTAIEKWNHNRRTAA